jgi:U3 small nucleolar RNA-associated protein 22
LSVLNESGDDVFSAVFTTKVDVPVLRFDLAATYVLFLSGSNIFRITIPDNQVKSHVDSPSTSFSSIQRITSLLQRALTDRVTLISITSPEPTSYPISSQPPPESPPLTLGLLLDPETSRRTNDYGPPQNDDAAKSFRDLWGSKTSVRRVKDGRILEAVQWDVKSTEEQYGIVKRIIRYILALHISAGVAGDIHFLTPTLFPLLAPPADVAATFSKTDGDAFMQLNQAYESFVRQIRDLQDMPLHISAVIPLSPGLTQTSVSPPYPQNFQKLAGQAPESYHVPSHQVIAQLEGSGKWPDDLRAIQKVKIGFLLQIAREMEKHRGVTTHVGLENPDADISNTGFLDVVYESGYVFRVRLQQDPNHREATLMERVLKNKLLAPKDWTRFEGALKQYREYFVYGAAHAQALHALRGRFYFLPHTIRLVKRWLAAHLLAPQVSERTIELIVCSIFLHPQPFVAPASAEVGFLRTLKFFATWDWKKEPMIVDLDESITKERHEEITKTFEVLRKQDPGVAHSAWAIYPSYETNESLWTKDRPSKAVAARITALAKSSLQVVSKDSGSVKVPRIFSRG